MSGVNHPSSAAAARNYEATQSLKRSVQAAFDGNGKAFPPSNLLFIFHFVSKKVKALCL